MSRDRRPTDRYGRTLYGDSVHRDFYPLHWIPAPLVLWCTSGLLPTIITLIGTIILAVLFCHNQIFMMPRDTPPKHT